jgi:hypothetical protein
VYGRRNTAAPYEAGGWALGTSHYRLFTICALFIYTIMSSAQNALDALKAHTKIDIDALDITVAERFNNESSTSDGFFFGDMTGNQAITLGAILSLPSPGKDELVNSSFETAKRLLDSGKDKEVLTIAAEGSEGLVYLAVDVLVMWR